MRLKYTQIRRVAANGLFKDYNEAVILAKKRFSGDLGTLLRKLIGLRMVLLYSGLICHAFMRYMSIVF